MGGKGLLGMQEQGMEGQMLTQERGMEGEKGEVV